MASIEITFAIHSSRAPEMEDARAPQLYLAIQFASPADNLARHGLSPANTAIWPPPLFSAGSYRDRSKVGGRDS